MRSQPRTKKQPTARKKFYKPPVKLACLSCRASRVRCDGREPCSKCTSKSKACVYLPSQRGRGKRISPRSSKPILQEMNKSPRATPTDCFTDHTYSFIVALLHLNIESSSLLGHLSQLSQPKLLPSTVRLYCCEEDILAAYYKLIHPSFPVLPPPNTASLVDDESEHGIFGHISLFALPYRPRSSLSLAIASVLALMPHPEDRAPSSGTSRSYRLVYSRALFQMAVLSIESDYETDRLGKGPHSSQEPLHPDVPASIEKIIALLILAIYEFLHHGSLRKMQYRAGQALALALDKSLDYLEEEEDKYTEARRRAFWVTYYCVLQGRVDGSSLPSIMNRSHPSTAYPRFAADPNGWRILIESQRALTLTTQIASDVHRSSKNDLEQPSAQLRLEDVYGKIHKLLIQSQSLCHSPPLDTSYRSEYHVALKIRILSRIQLLSAQIIIYQLQPLLSKNEKGPPQFFSLRNADTGNVQTESRSNFATSEMEYTAGTISTLQTSNYGADWPVPSAHDSCNTAATTYAQKVHQIKERNTIKLLLKAALAISSLVQVYHDPASLLSRSGDKQDPRPFDSNSHREASPIISPTFAFGLKQASSVFALVGHQACMAQTAYRKQHSATHMSDPLIATLRQSLKCVAEALSYNSVSFEAFRHITDDVISTYHRAFSKA